MDLRCKSKFTREQKIARTENYYQPIHALRKKIKAPPWSEATN